MNVGKFLIALRGQLLLLLLLLHFTEPSKALSYPNITLFEGDIVATYRPTAYAYGKAFADELVQKGIIKDPPSNDIFHDDNNDTENASVPGIPLWRNDFHSDTELFHIPVYFTPGAYSADELKVVKRGIRRLQKQTGAIKFDWIDTTPTDGTPFMHVGTFGMDICASYIGLDERFATTADGQFVWIGKSCLAKEGIIQHAMMHALGFYHEQSRPDRDTYLTVYFTSIAADEAHNFQIRTEVDSLGTPYDYNSVMQGGEYYLSTTGGKTMDAFGNAIGQRERSSLLDKIQIRLMYQCTSGSRTYSDHMAAKCNNSDCKCGFNKPGCRSQWVNYDDRCKGALVCKNNVCKNP